MWHRVYGHGDLEALGRVVSGNCSPAAVAAGRSALRSKCLHGYHGGHSLRFPMVHGPLLYHASAHKLYRQNVGTCCLRMILQECTCHQHAAGPHALAQEPRDAFLEVGPRSQVPLSHC